jgi:hypothetical protein
MEQNQTQVNIINALKEKIVYLKHIFSKYEVEAADMREKIRQNLEQKKKFENVSWLA